MHNSWVKIFERISFLFWKEGPNMNWKEGPYWKEKRSEWIFVQNFTQLTLDVERLKYLNKKYRDSGVNTAICFFSLSGK